MNRKDKALEFADATYNIQITGRHVEVTEAMKDYALEKISKIERFMNRIIDVNVIMDIQRVDHRVEIILKLGNTKITSKASTTDMYVSIDQAVDKLETQILRYKSKLQDHHAKGHAVLNMAVNVLNPNDLEEDLESDEEGAGHHEFARFKPHRVVKQESRPLKTLTYEEAMMKMELSGDQFLIFKNEEDQKLKVIYRRHDENYGIIEPLS
ncbi:MAG: ribosome hibernation-promoting factor, HPF/YfiA family [Parachlamydiaceae bacterium]